MTKTINTVSVYRSLLQEDDYEIKAVAVRQLLDNINLHWTDIANDINSMYIVHYLDKICWKTPTFQTASLWLCSSPRSTSISMSMIKH